MSYVTVVPESVLAAASELGTVGSAISQANAAAAASTTRVVAAAQDEVSTAIAALFGSHGQEFQALSAEAAAFHSRLVAALTGGAASYLETEAANVLGLMGGGLAGQSAAAALSSAAAVAAGDGPFDFLLKLVEGLGRTIGAQVDRRIWLAGKAAEQALTQGILANGLKLAAKNGVEVFTDGKNFVLSGGRFPGLYSAERFLEIIENPRYASEQFFKVYTDLGLDAQFLRNLVGSQLEVVARGQGLAQSYIQRVGQQIYLIDTDVQGQIIRQFQGTEAQIRGLQLASQAYGDALRAIQHAEEEYLRQAEQFTRRLAEQAFKEAEIIVNEARIAGLIK